MAGDLDFGEEVLAALAPFVWRREVNPAIAEEMAHLVARARVELDVDVERDLKHGRGGIRDAEFFVQSLQLIWGGREPALRARNTLEALGRLRTRGFVTDREAREVSGAYLVLRRLEHRVQNATGLQTHQLPRDADLMDRIARSLGFDDGAQLWQDLERARRAVAPRFASLLPRAEGAAPAGAEGDAYERLFAAIDAAAGTGLADEREESAVLDALAPVFGSSATPDLARHVAAMARRPDGALGVATRDRHPELAPVLVGALADAADPEQATRLCATLFARLPTPSVYARALARDPGATRRLATLLGASAFLGEAVVRHPELADRMLFLRKPPTPESACATVRDEIEQARTDAAAATEEFDADVLVGATRRAKSLVTLDVGLTDMAEEIGTRDATLVLSALADAVLEEVTRFALGERGEDPDHGLSVIAVGKLGGREVGYGSDLDVLFVYDDDREDNQERYARIAQRVLRLLSMPHGSGLGYELDTRLRPSGNQGLLVVSFASFARYHRAASAGDVSASGAAQADDWERQALLRARPCAGDAALGARVAEVVAEAAYMRGAPPPERMHRLRLRMERELAGERRLASPKGPKRFDLKLGHGGLVDVEFAVQWLQMKHGHDPRVRSTDTMVALGALEACGYIDARLASTFSEGYRFLRRLEQRLRVLHGTSTQLIEEGAPGLAALARRMGFEDGPRGLASAALLQRYEDTTRDIRVAYAAVLGLDLEADASGPTA
jgi:glutamate-ammonia-ligase adenylyltransferase